MSKESQRKVGFDAMLNAKEDTQILFGCKGRSRELMI